ncbi:hypothetical protein [Bacillus sp. 95MFCvi2.1]|uniref:hypothetical protein n=1 Tax=Bacillus sp. 95MFCvi2.1 TaxID=1151121 RepID=UPI0003672BE8|nr:hypothetical protein [Bacillus sp. 95MFCvi2.1]
MKTKRIFKKALAIELISRGHELLKVEPHNRIKGFFVYTFLLSDELIDDIWSITQ